MKQIFLKLRDFDTASFQGKMRVFATGLLLSMLTTFVLQFAMFFQEWGRYNQTTNVIQALQYAAEYMFKAQAWFSVFEFFLLFLVVLVIINRYFLTIALYLILTIVMFVAEYMKVKARNEPILFSDLSEVTAANGLTGMVNKQLLTASIICILGIIIIAVLLEYWVKKRRLGNFGKAVHNMLFQAVGVRIGIVLIAGGILAIPFMVNADRNQAWLSHAGYERVVYSSEDDALWNGPLATFLSNVSTIIMREPSGYSAKTMRKVQHRYEREAQNINVNRTSSKKSQTLIYVLSESLTDPNEIKELHYSGENVSKNIDQVMQQSTVSGKMLSSGYGGGTANIEYMTLAGFPLATYAPEMTVPYVQVVPFANVVPNVASLFQKKEILHPFVGSLYNRQGAYKKMGINHFYTTDSDKNPYPKKYQAGITKADYPSDENAFKFLESKISSSSNNQSQFLQLMTMQNHMPYVAGEYPNNNYHVLSPAVSGGTKTQIESYLAGVHESDLALKKLINKLDKSSRPVTMVFYGDHWPGIFTFVDPQKQAKIAHETDYFIYQNDAAKKLDNGAQKQNRNYASPSDFPAMTLQAMNVKVSPFFALQTDVKDELPAFANYTRGTFVDNNGNELKTKDLTTKQKKLLHDFKLVQYDLSSGKHYLSNSFTKK